MKVQWVIEILIIIEVYQGRIIILQKIKIDINQSLRLKGMMQKQRNILICLAMKEQNWVN